MEKKILFTGEWRKQKWVIEIKDTLKKKGELIFMTMTYVVFHEYRYSCTRFLYYTFPPRKRTSVCVFFSFLAYTKGNEMLGKTRTRWIALSRSNNNPYCKIVSNLEQIFYSKINVRDNFLRIFYCAIICNSMK